MLCRSPKASVVAAVAALAIVTWAARPARSTISPPFGDLRAPLLLRLEGVVATSPETARQWGFTATSLEFLGAGTMCWLGVTDARTLGGDHFAMGKDVLAAVAPFTPNLLVAGPPELATRLRKAPPGTRVLIEGLVDRASRIYYLRRVELPSQG